MLYNTIMKVGEYLRLPLLSDSAHSSVEFGTVLWTCVNEQIERVTLAPLHKEADEINECVALGTSSAAGGRLMVADSLYRPGDFLDETASDSSTPTFALAIPRPLRADFEEARITEICWSYDEVVAALAATVGSVDMVQQLLTRYTNVQPTG
jgi:hypothetical protein